jgi:hypothetical protein
MEDFLSAERALEWAPEYVLFLQPLINASVSMRCFQIG